jgi:membrane protein implicated in regulation of membrane protease activity
MFLILIAIGWLYVAVMMAVAEATSPVGSVLGALITFLLYGVGPVALLLYILGTPARKKLRKQREADELAQWQAQQAAQTATTVSDAPDAGGQAAADAVAPVRKEP